MSNQNRTKSARELRNEGFHRIGACRDRYYIKETKAGTGASIIEIYHRQGLSRNYELCRKLVCVDEEFR